MTGLAESRRRLRGAMMMTAFMTAFGFLLVGTQQSPLPVFLAFAATACVWTPVVPLTDAYALRAVARYGLDYGPVRRCRSNDTVRTRIPAAASTPPAAAGAV